jgi:hypothetical protein
MRTHLRGLFAAVAIGSLLITGAGPASARSSGNVDALRIAASRSASVGIAPAPCDDSGYRFLGGKWHRPYEWSFNPSAAPSALDRSAVEAVLVRSFTNITGARNNCGRADRISATAVYLGRTKRRVNCNAPDGHNVVGFGRLPFGVLALTCYWIKRGRMVEADIRINRYEPWALSTQHCRYKPMLEATITHEAGHVFGLQHIGERRHGRLTMSPYLDGPCENAEATLGLGDMLGLEALY